MQTIIYELGSLVPCLDVNIPLNQYCGHFGSSFGQYILHSAGFRKTHPPSTILLATKWCQGWLTTASPGASDWKWEGATTPSSLVAIASGKSLRAAFQASALTGGKDFLRFVALPGSKVRESTLWWLLLPSQGGNVVVTHPWLPKADSRASANASW